MIETRMTRYNLHLECFERSKNYLTMELSKDLRERLFANIGENIEFTSVSHPNHCTLASSSVEHFMGHFLKQIFKTKQTRQFSCYIS